MAADLVDGLVVGAVLEIDGEQERGAESLRVGEPVPKDPRVFVHRDDAAMRSLDARLIFSLDASILHPHAGVSYMN